MSMQMSAEDFELLVSDALDEMPAELSGLIDNCVILVEDSPPPDVPDLLGLYDGIPLTERGETYAGVLPDRILIFRVSDPGDLRDRGGRRGGGAHHGRARGRPPLRYRRRGCTNWVTAEVVPAS